jgi:hypothetical protein
MDTYPWSMSRLEIELQRPRDRDDRLDPGQGNACFWEHGTAASNRLRPHLKPQAETARLSFSLTTSSRSNTGENAPKWLRECREGVSS